MPKASLRYRPFRIHCLKSFRSTCFVCCGVNTLLSSCSSKRIHVYIVLIHCFCAIWWMISAISEVPAVSIIRAMWQQVSLKRCYSAQFSKITTTWSTGERVGVLFACPLKHREIRYSITGILH